MKKNSFNILPKVDKKAGLLLKRLIYDFKEKVRMVLVLLVESLTTQQ